MANIERTEWRDKRISEKHRQWGISCLAGDVDFMLIEYIENIPVALIEYKHEMSRWSKTDSGIRALTSLSNMASLPSFVVVYTDDLHYYTIYALNSRSAGLLQSHGINSSERITERRYATFLNRIRGIEITETEANPLFNR